MTFPRPTLSALRDQSRADLAARLPGTDPVLRRSVARALADVFAGLLHHQYGYLDYIVRQVIPDTAEGAYLERWCRLVGIARKAPTIAAGTIDVVGSDGTTIPVGTRFTRGDGVTYAATSAATVTSGTASLAVEAESAGDGANLDAGATVTLVTAIPGLVGTGTVAAGGISGGGPQESDTALRARLRARLSTPPQGGAAADYVAWALAVPGVTRAWAFPLNRGAGTVDVAFVMDDREDIIPETEDVAAVQAAIDARRPVTADCVVFAPVAEELDIEIADLLPDTAAVRAAIEAAIAAQIARDARPGGTIYRSRIIEAISAAAGEGSHTLTVPATDVSYDPGEMAIPGTVTFT